MRWLTSLPTLALAAVLALPYGAPALCRALHPDMGSMQAPTEREGCPTPHEPAGDRCDLAACATVVTAPVPSVSLTLAVFPVVEVDVAVAPGPEPGDPAAPLTPPPIA